MGTQSLACPWLACAPFILSTLCALVSAAGEEPESQISQGLLFQMSWESAVWFQREEQPLGTARSCGPPYCCLRPVA